MPRHSSEREEEKEREREPAFNNERERGTAFKEERKREGEGENLLLFQFLLRYIKLRHKYTLKNGYVEDHINTRLFIKCFTAKKGEY